MEYYEKALDDSLRELIGLGRFMLENITKNENPIYMPCHISTNSLFYGINAVILLSKSKDGRSNDYVTTQDLVDRQGTLREGATPATCFFFQGELSKVVGYHVFNLDDVRGPGFDILRKPIRKDSQERKETFGRSLLTILGIKPRASGGISGYSKGEDVEFNLDGNLDPQDVDIAFSEIFGGLIHWARHRSRIIRYHPQGIEAVSKSEIYEGLVAEIGSALMCASYGYRHIHLKETDEHPWESLVETEPKILLAAAADAQLAVDYINNLVVDFKSTKEE